MTDKRCPNVGTIVIGGRPIVDVRCELDAGHDVDLAVPSRYGRLLRRATPHCVTFEWEDELPIVFDTPEASIEVEVPIVDVDGDR